MAESGDRGLVPLSGRPLRPQPAGHAWAWIVLTVGVVIFMTITLWVVSRARSSDDPFEDLAGDWKMRWAQVPGPANLYVQNADRTLMEGDRDGAALWLSKALALEPQQHEVWVKMACLSVVHSSPYTVGDRGMHRLIDGPLNEHIPLMDWNGIRELLREHPGRSAEWLAHCSGVVVPALRTESEPESLDTKAASP